MGFMPKGAAKKQQARAKKVKTKTKKTAAKVIKGIKGK